MKYRIIARVPFERTSYSEPCETIHHLREAISINDAFQIAGRLAEKDENYDASIEVWDDEGKQHFLWDYDNAAHVRCFQQWNGGDFPW